MIISVKARTPILALILFVFGIGNVFAETKVVVIPMAGDSTDPAIIQDHEDRITELENVQPFSVFVSGEQRILVLAADTVIRELPLTTPAAGVVILNSSLSAYEGSAGDGLQCSISTFLAVDDTHVQRWESPGLEGRFAQLSGTRGFTVPANMGYHFRLMCNHTGEASTTTTVYDSSLTATFTPSP